MKNPYVRLREAAGIGQREFERKYEFSHTVMVSIEAGLYPDLSAYMIESLGAECVEKGVEAGRILWNEYEKATLQEAYHAWQKTMREKVSVDLTVSRLLQAPSLSPMHFFIKERFGSLRSFCVALKVPVATVTRYVTGITRTMPRSLESALREAGMPDFDLTELKTAQQSWTTEYT